MYLRHTIRKKDGKVHRYWRLVRSVRVGRRVIQQTVAQLGELDEQGRIEARGLALQMVGTPDQGQLFDDGTANLTVPVRLKGFASSAHVSSAMYTWHSRCGAAWVSKPFVNGLLPIGKERIAWAKMAAVLVTARFCEPSANYILPRIGIDERRFPICCSLGDEEVNKDRLYRGLDHLLRTRLRSKRICRSAAESYSPFRMKYCSTTSPAHILRARPKQSRGQAWLFPRDRPDCKQVCIALGRDLRRLSFGLRGVRRQYPATLEPCRRS